MTGALIKRKFFSLGAHIFTYCNFFSNFALDILLFVKYNLLMVIFFMNRKLLRIANSSQNSLNKIISLTCVEFVNRVEPAAVFGFHGNIKVGVFKAPESTAVGLLLGWSFVISHWSLGRNLKVRSLVIGRILKNGHWSLVIGHWEGPCAVAIGLWLFIIFGEPAAVFKAHKPTGAGSLFYW
jgi:hypothetical protein